MESQSNTGRAGRAHRGHLEEWSITMLEWRDRMRGPPIKTLSDEGKHLYNAGSDNRIRQSMNLASRDARLTLHKLDPTRARQASLPIGSLKPSGSVPALTCPSSCITLPMQATGDICLCTCLELCWANLCLHSSCLLCCAALASQVC